MSESVRQFETVAAPSSGLGDATPTASDKTIPAEPQTGTTAGLSSACITCIVIAGLAVIASFSQPISLLVALPFGGYAYHLYRGGRDFTATMGDGRTRARAWLLWVGIGALSLMVGVTWTPALVIAAASGGYAAYLFTGGRDVIRESKSGTRRSAVWLYYAGIAVLSAALGFTYPAAFVVSILALSYSVYLYRGGRWILWIW